MSKKVMKHFQVLTRSWINNAIHEGGSIASILVDPETFQPGPHLKEIEDYEPKHTQAQQEAADAESARTEERLSKQAEAPEDDEPVLPLENQPQAEQPAQH